MRQIGQLSNEQDARRFADWLVAQKIESHAELEGDAWRIWVRDEDRLTEARTALEHFRGDPTNPLYADAARQAANVRRETEQQREEARKQQVRMNDRWAKTTPDGSRRTPVVFTVLALCGVIYLFTLNEGKQGKQNVEVVTPKPVTDALAFSSPADQEADLRRPEFAPLLLERNIKAIQAHLTWSSIRRGEVWRLFTPALMHGSITHLLFNLYMFYVIGSRIELRYGSLAMLGFVLLSAGLSNVAQAYAVGPNFLGLSGVGYAVFGFCWMKSKYDPASGIQLEPGTVFIMMLWFIVCIASDVPGLRETFGPLFGRGVANFAHGGGLLTGMVVGYPWQRLVNRSGPRG